MNFQVVHGSLGYVIGVMVSDAYVGKRRIELKVRDREFRDNFVAHLTRLGLSPWCKDRSYYYYAYAYSLPLISIVKSGSWKSLLTHPDDKLGFLRGFFDGDGSGLFPSYVNSSQDVLDFTKGLLEDFGITTSPVVQVKPRVYEVFIHPDSYTSFMELEPTVIPRKRSLIAFSIRYCSRYHYWKRHRYWWHGLIELRRMIAPRFRRKPSTLHF